MLNLGGPHLTASETSRDFGIISEIELIWLKDREACFDRLCFITFTVDNVFFLRCSALGMSPELGVRYKHFKLTYTERQTRNNGLPVDYLMFVPCVESNRTKHAAQQ